MNNDKNHDKNNDMNNDLSEEEKASLQKDLNEYLLIYDLITIILIATLFNLDYTSYKITEKYNKLNNIDEYEDIQHRNNSKTISAILFVYVTLMFVYINYNDYLLGFEKNDNYNDTFDDFQNFIASILAFVATSIGVSNIEF